MNEAMSRYFGNFGKLSLCGLEVCSGFQDVPTLEQTTLETVSRKLGLPTLSRLTAATSPTFHSL